MFSIKVSWSVIIIIALSDIWSIGFEKTIATEGPPSFSCLIFTKLSGRSFLIFVVSLFPETLKLIVFLSRLTSFEKIIISALPIDNVSSAINSARVLSWESLNIVGLNCLLDSSVKMILSILDYLFLD